MSDQVIKAFEELRVKGLLTPEKDYASFVAGFNAGRDVRLVLLAADHKGMRVDYSGLFKQSIVALSRGVKEPGLAEMLRQLQGHITELGRRWYCGDTAVVDELLQLYAVEDRARDALKLQGRAQQNPVQVNRIPALDEHLRYILGRPNFWCHHLANALRAMGHEIARKAEEEQAAVIHWLLNAYFEHGPGWREAVEKILAAEREKELAKGGEH